MELKLSGLTVEQKIGQLICARGYINEDDKKFILEMVKKKCVGGIQMGFRDGCKEFIDEVILIPNKHVYNLVKKRYNRFGDEKCLKHIQ